MDAFRNLFQNPIRSFVCDCFRGLFTKIPLGSFLKTLADIPLEIYPRFFLANPFWFIFRISPRGSSVTSSGFQKHSSWNFQGLLHILFFRIPATVCLRFSRWISKWISLGLSSEKLLEVDFLISREVLRGFLPEFLHRLLKIFLHKFFSSIVQRLVREPKDLFFFLLDYKSFEWFFFVNNWVCHEHIFCLTDK